MIAAPSRTKPVKSVQPPVSDEELLIAYAQTGQRVMFCAEPTAKTRTVRLRYYARVITPGTYIWEPAIVESRTDPDRAALTPMGKVTIR